MSLIQLPEDLERAIEREVAEGRAASLTAFLEEAVTRLIQDAHAEAEELEAAAHAGAAAIDAGDFLLIETPDDLRRLHARLMAKLNDRD